MTQATVCSGSGDRPVFSATNEPKTTASEAATSGMPHVLRRERLAAAKANEKVAKSLEGMQIVKTILVKNKLVNLIVKPQ